MAERPRISCLVPTVGRPGWLLSAVAQFLACRVAGAELLIVSEDGLPAALAPWLDRSPVRHLACAAGLSLGAKRNLAADAARGEVLLHWDDDDLQGATRIRRQWRALQRPGVRLCGSSRLLFHDERDGAVWSYRYDDPQPWVAGATLAYRRELWRAQPFEDRSVGEDNRFVAAAAPGELLDLADDGLCLGSIHAGNTSPRDTSGGWWQRRHRLPVAWQRQRAAADQAAQRLRGDTGVLQPSDPGERRP